MVFGAANSGRQVGQNMIWHQDAERHVVKCASASTNHQAPAGRCPIWSISRASIKRSSDMWRYHARAAWSGDGPTMNTVPPPKPQRSKVRRITGCR